MPVGNICRFMLRVSDAGGWQRCGLSRSRRPKAAKERTRGKWQAVAPRAPSAMEVCARRRRVRHGYGALVAAFGSSCSVALNTELLTVDHSGREIMLETSRGNVRARAVICTLPTNLIAEEAVRFRPPLPDKVAAAAGLPLGYAEKAMAPI